MDLVSVAQKLTKSTGRPIGLIEGVLSICHSHLGGAILSLSLSLSLSLALSLLLGVASKYLPRPLLSLTQ
jgi:hypothetical protein